eukprot:scaffold1450_cov181-Ochromonas_danica.AAC.3
MYPDDWRVGDVVSDNNISFVETNVLLMEIYIVGSLCTSIPALGHPEGSLACSCIDLTGTTDQLANNDDVHDVVFQCAGVG